MDQDSIHPGQTWASKYFSGRTVRVTVVMPDKIGFIDKVDGQTHYLRRPKFLSTFNRIKGA